MQGVQDWERASEVTLFLYACRVCHRCRTAQGINQPLGHKLQSCPLWARSSFTQLCSEGSILSLVTPASGAWPSHIYTEGMPPFTISLPVHDERSCGLMASLLGLHLHHFLRGGDPEPHRNLTGPIRKREGKGSFHSQASPGVVAYPLPTPHKARNA